MLIIFQQNTVQLKKRKEGKGKKGKEGRKGKGKERKGEKEKERKRKGKQRKKKQKRKEHWMIWSNFVLIWLKFRLDGNLGLLELQTPVPPRIRQKTRNV